MSQLKFNILIGGRAWTHPLTTPLPKTSKNVPWQKKSVQLFRFCPVIQEFCR